MGDPFLRMIAHGFHCAGCGHFHDGLFDLEFAHPDPWRGPTDLKPNSAVLTALNLGQDFLSEDLCLMGEHRFVRSILPMPVLGTDHHFAFGLWASLSPRQFLIYIDHFDGPDAAQMPPAFSWVSNRLPGAAPLPVPAQLQAQNHRQRPVLTITDTEHPYYTHQTQGLTPAALVDLYAQFGHSPVPLA